MSTPLPVALPRATPESQGVPSAAIHAFVDAAEANLRDLHSFMLLRHGHVIAEGWWHPYQRDLSHMLFSLSKSFTSTAIGLAVDEGRLSIDDPVLSFFPDDAPARVSRKLAAMRVRHLLSMSTGQKADMTVGTRHLGGWVRRFLRVPVIHEPGTQFLYNSGATYMLSAIIQKTTGMKLIDYLGPRLFDPLGISQRTWEESPEGINVGGWGLAITTEAIARFGQCWLNKGIWQGQRLIPEAWIETASAFHVKNGDDLASDWAQGYGFQFWRCRHNAYRGDGAFGQYCVIFPEQDAVLAMTSGLADMQPPLNLVWEHLLPALGNDPLPADAAAQAALTTRLSSLGIPAPTGASASPLAARIAGRTYRFEPNPLRLASMQLTFDADGCVNHLKFSRRSVHIKGRWGSWHASRTRLGFAPFDQVPMAVAAACTWTAPDVLRLDARYIETPFVHTWNCRFSGDQVVIEMRQNVGFEPTLTFQLTGHAT